MKKKPIIIILSILLILSALLCACADVFNIGQATDATSSTESTEQSKIDELEAKLITLLQNQQLSEDERKKEIAALTAAIEKLKEASDTAKPTDKETEKVTTPAESFKYTLENGKAVITQISTINESVTIPSSIDGYRVYSIGSDALSSSTVKSVVVSDGIEKLDWFAFRGCLMLGSVTLPNSVVSIGYGAFDNTAKSLTIICSRDSFAHQYAQSYGITYDIT